METFDPKHKESVELTKAAFADGAARVTIQEFVRDSLALLARNVRAPDGSTILIFDVEELAEIDADSYEYRITDSCRPVGSEEIPLVSLMRNVAGDIWAGLAAANADEECLSDFLTAIGDDLCANSSDDDFVTFLNLFNEDLIAALNAICAMMNTDSAPTLEELTMAVSETLMGPDDDPASDHYLAVLYATDRLVHLYKTWNGCVSGSYDEYDPEQA